MCSFFDVNRDVTWDIEKQMNNLNRLSAGISLLESSFTGEDTHRAVDLLTSIGVIQKNGKHSNDIASFENLNDTVKLIIGRELLNELRDKKLVALEGLKEDLFSDLNDFQDGIESSVNQDNLAECREIMKGNLDYTEENLDSIVFKSHCFTYENFMHISGCLAMLVKGTVSMARQLSELTFEDWMSKDTLTDSEKRKISDKIDECYRRMKVVEKKYELHRFGIRYDDYSRTMEFTVSNVTGYKTDRSAKELGFSKDNIKEAMNDALQYLEKDETVISDCKTAIALTREWIAKAKGYNGDLLQAARNVTAVTKAVYTISKIFADQTVTIITKMKREAKDE